MYATETFRNIPNIFGGAWEWISRNLLGFTDRVLQKHLEGFENSAANVALKEVKPVFQGTYRFILPIQSPHTNTAQDHIQNHTRKRQRTDLNNDTSYSLKNVLHLHSVLFGAAMFAPLAIWLILY